MTKASYEGTLRGCHIVTETLNGCHPLHKDYPLLPGDILLKREDGWYKFGPGLGIMGFQLTLEQQDTLQPSVEDIHFGVGGMGYFLSEDGS